MSDITGDYQHTPMVTLATYHERIDDLERQLAEERARINCATNNGWLSDDLECAGEDGPACWKHLLTEARGELEALEEAQGLLRRFHAAGLLSYESGKTNAVGDVWRDVDRILSQEGNNAD